MRPQESVCNFHAVDGDWRLWCRLCAKEDVQNNINILFKEEHPVGGEANGNNLGLVEAVRKYFLVNITRIDELPKMLCSDCFSLVTSIVNFAERVNKVQQMFWTLQNSDINTQLYLQSLRIKYGILDEEREHVITQRQLPEEHYIEEKPIIDELEENIFAEETTASNPLEPTRISIKITKKLLDKEKENAEDNYDGNDNDFGNETGSESYNVDDASIAQTKFEKTTRKRKQRVAGSLSQQEEKHTTTSKKQQCRAERKKKTTKRSNTLLEKGKTNTKYAKNYEKQKLADSIIINFEDETESDGGIHDEDFVPPKYVKEKEKKSVTTDSQQEVKIRKRAKKMKGVPLCDVCNKVFAEHSTLRKHKETHNPNKHTCPECGLQLNTRATFRQHMVVHSAEMKYKCEFCERPFKRRSTMVMHSRLHTGLKPYLCEFCGRTFPTSVNCRTHKTLAHRKELAAIEASSESKTI